MKVHYKKLKGRIVAGKRICVYPSVFYGDACASDYPHRWPIHFHCKTIAEKTRAKNSEKNPELLVVAYCIKGEVEGRRNG
jgi:hypothetical protein